MIVNIAIFGAFSLMVLVFGLFLWQTLFAPEKKSYTNSKPEITDSDHQPGKENSLGSRAIPRGSNSTEEAIAEYTKWLAIFTLFLVLATVGLFISGERNVDVARRSADAARDSAIATQNSVELSDKTAERQLRAYVGFKGVVTIANVAQGQKPIIIAPVGNFGQTPAYKVSYSTDAKLFPKGTIEFPKPVKIPGLRVVNPGSDGFEIHASMKNVLTETELAALANKQAAIYFFGEIVYFDIFSHRARTTKFRLSYEGELLGSGRMGISDEGNEAD